MLKEKINAVLCDHIKDGNMLLDYAAELRLEGEFEAAEHLVSEAQYRKEMLFKDHAELAPIVIKLTGDLDVPGNECLKMWHNVEVAKANQFFQRLKGNM